MKRIKTSYSRELVKGIKAYNAMNVTDREFFIKMLKRVGELNIEEKNNCQLCGKPINSEHHAGKSCVQAVA